MVYFSLILVLCGIFLLVFSMLLSSSPLEDNESHVPVKRSDDIREEDLDLDIDFLDGDDTSGEFRTGKPAHHGEDRIKIIEEDDDFLPEIDFESSTEDEKHIEKLPFESEFSDELQPEPDGESLKPEETETSDTAILFEDSSGVIDYENGYGTIDPTRDRYRNIKRRGMGEITLEKAGISFHVGKKLFRYDFHKISSLKTGRNYIALIPEGESPVKLFIFTEPGPVISRVADAFVSYRKLWSR